MPFINLPTGKTFAWAPRTGSTAILRAIANTFFAERLNIPVATPNKSPVDPHALLQSTILPTPGNEVVILLRNPVERFRSACSRTGKTVEQGLSLIDKDPHFTPLGQWFRMLPRTSFTPFRFETEFDKCTQYIGIGIVAQENIGDKKPTLTAKQLASVQEAYADDIKFYEQAFAVEEQHIYTPTEVPLWAFRQVLIEDGMLDPILEKIKDNAVLINFLEYGNYVTRSSPSLTTIANQFNKSSAEIDELFRRASTLQL